MPPVQEAYDQDNMANLVNIKFWKKEFEYELYMFTPILEMIDKENKSMLPYGNEVVFTMAARPKLGNTTKMVCGAEYICKTRLFEQCSIKIDCWRTHSFGICYITDVQSMVNHVETGKKTVMEEMKMDISYDILCLLFEGVQTCTPKPSLCETAPAAGDHFLEAATGISQQVLDSAIELLAGQGVALSDGVHALGSYKLINKIRRALEGLCQPFCKPGDPEAKNIGKLALTHKGNIMKPQFVYQEIGFYSLDFAGEDPLNKLVDPATSTHYLYIFHKSAVKGLFQDEVGIRGPFEDAKSTDKVWKVDTIYGLKLYSCSRAVILPIVC